MSRALIVTGGQVNTDTLKHTYNQSTFDMVIGVDHGMDYLMEASVVPDILLGDYDSCDEKTLDRYRNKGIKVIDYPSEKDMTDTHLALDYAVALGVNEVVLFGATGSRFDHTLSNLFVLKKYQDKLAVTIHDDYNCIWLADNNQSITKNDYKYISLVPLSEVVTCVTFEGVKYPLDKATLYQDDSYGISNEIVEEKATLTYEGGTLLIVCSND